MVEVKVTFQLYDKKSLKQLEKELQQIYLKADSPIYEWGYLENQDVKETKD